MSLPSQAPRVAATGRAVVRTHRRRGLRFPPIAVAGVIVVAGSAAAWYFTRGDDGPKPGPEAAAAADHVLDDPFELQTPATGASRNTSLRTEGRGAGTPAPPPARSEPAPLVITQGERTPEPNPVLDAPDRPAASTLGESLDRSTPEPAAQSPTPARTGSLSRALEAADQRLAANDPVAARVILSDALRDRTIDEGGRSQLRARLTQINQDLLFSSKVVKGDPMTETYTIASGDRLSKLPEKLGLATDWRLIQRVNGITDPNRIQLGQKLKIVRGPFHAVVDKSDYRLDLFTGPPEDESAWTYIRSFRVGLGEDNSTPTGSFVVKRDSKLINPHWVNPRTGETFDKEDPKNPIGERWVGLDGIGEDALKTGYGIHGTIEPDSIGAQKSMGCVRMLDEDVNLVYELLVEGISRVRIVD